MTDKSLKPARRFARPRTTTTEAGGFTITKLVDTPEVPEPPNEPSRQTKQALVLAMLRSEHGATLAQLVEATGWQPHTIRAALTGLRKKGHTIVKDKLDRVTRYAIEAAVQP
ncbi:DUF3489 domain-containing protein [Novosphingobium sp. Gsoil 351]|uniref:DUF3489 domain-containing protein n=1 Tax=Novosphingobium sp. Gsoil 351 TaxID=2675225 RepID=UPI001E4CC008|nr:DUF3489 domain-containing protein [Novosphingobium sp. Gsoil 351]